MLHLNRTPSISICLQDNIRLNGKDNVKAYNKAISDHEGVLTLYLYKNYNPGRHSFIKQAKSVGTAEVPIVPLDAFLQQEGFGEGPIKLIKIDIEGYEYTAMKAAKQTMQRASYLLTEFSPNMMKDIGQDPMDYINLLAGSRVQTETDRRKAVYRNLILPQLSGRTSR